MRVLEDEGFCTCCGNYAEYSYGDEDFSLVTKDLKNYNNYKNLYVYKCPKCGFISTDITSIDGVISGEVRNSLEYKNALNYSYLQGIDKELYDNHSAEVPANLYEAYSFVCLANKDYEQFVRAVNKSVELKLIMAKKYRRSQDELGGEEENDDLYDELDSLIKQSIEYNRKQIDYYYTQIDRKKDIFIKFIYIENLCALGKKSEAKKLLDVITSSNAIKADLKEYMYNLLEQ